MKEREGVREEESESEREKRNLLDDNHKLRLFDDRLTYRTQVNCKLVVLLVLPYTYTPQQSSTC